MFNMKTCSAVKTQLCIRAVASTLNKLNSGLFNVLQIIDVVHSILISVATIPNQNNPNKYSLKI